MFIARAIDDFLADAATGSRHTRRTYRTALNQFRVYLEQQQLDPDATAVTVLDVDQLLTFASWLLDSQRTHKRTLQTYMSALMSFVRFLLIRDWLPLQAGELTRLEQGMRRLRRNQKPPALIPHPPLELEVRELIGAARAAELKHPTQRDWLLKLRNIALIETLLSTGLRVGELVQLVRKQLHPHERAAWVIGKGDYVRHVYFSDEAWQATQRYLNERRTLDAAMTNAVGNLPVFARHDRRASDRVLPLTSTSVQNVIAHLAFQARLEDRGITPHALRHYFGTRVYRATQDLAVTQTALGHASPETTRIYAQLTDNAVKDAHDKAFAAAKDAGDSSMTNAAMSQERAAN